MYLKQIAMFREFWKRHRWWVFCFLAVLISGIITLGSLTSDEGLNVMKSLVIHCFIVRLEMVLFLWMIFFRQFDVRKSRINFPCRLYVLPVRTSFLVACQMIFPALIVAGLYIVTVVVARFALLVTWPIFGPLLMMFAFLASMQAIVWLTTGFRTLQFGIGLLCYVQFGRLASLQYGAENIFQLPATPWGDLGIGKVLALFLCIGAAYGIAVIGILRDRRGDCNGWGGLNAFFAGLRNMLPRRKRPFRFAPGAQFWVEWRKKGLLAPTAALVLCLLSILVGGMGAKSVELTFWLLIMVGLLSLGSPFFIGLAMGSMGDGGIMTSFRATRPVSSFTQAMVAFGAAIWSIIMAWAVILLASLLILAWAWAIGQVDILIGIVQVGIGLVKEAGYIKVLALVGIMPLYFCAAVGIGGTLRMTGRTWVLCTFCGCGLGGLVLWGTVGGIGSLPEWLCAAVSNGLPWGVGTICLAGTVWMFFRACQRELIHQWVCFFAGCAWAVLFAGLWFVWRYALAEGVKALWFSRVPDASSIILMGGLLTLTVLPLASGPLALAWNRHR